MKKSTTTLVVVKYLDYVDWSAFFFYVFLIYVLTIFTWSILFLILHFSFIYYWRDFWPRFSNVVWFFIALKNDFFFLRDRIYNNLIKPYIRYWTFFTAGEAYFISVYVSILLYLVYL